MDPTRMDQASMPHYYAPAQASAAPQEDPGRHLVPIPAHAEGGLARTIEAQTARLPPDRFLWAALGAMAVSLALQLAGRQTTRRFLGQWASSFLLLGVYNTIAKVSGSHSRQTEAHPVQHR